MKPRRGLVAATALTLVLAACSSSTDVEPVGVSSESTAYLESVEEIQGRVNAGFDEVGNVLERSYPTREVFFAAVRDVGYEGLAASALSLAEELTPPPGYEADHESWVAHRRLAAEIAGEMNAAVEADDLQEMFRVMTVLAQDWAALLDGATREFCLEVAEGPNFCPPPDDLPGGEYGVSVYDTMRRGRYSTLGLFDFFEDMSPEERSVRLEEVQPGIEGTLKHTLEAMRAIEPPIDYQPEHQVMVEALEGLYLTALRITAANLARDDDEVRALFAQSLTIERTALAAISSEYLRIVGPWFGPG